MRFVITSPLGAVNVTCSSRGIESIEIVGLLGSMRTSSISLECGSTLPKGLSFGGGRWSLPTNSSVSGAPLLVGASTFGAILTALVWPSASTTLPTSLRASTYVAPPASKVMPTAASSTRFAIHQARRGGSGSSGPGAVSPGGGSGGGVVTVLKCSDVRRSADQVCRPAAAEAAGCV